MNDRAAPAELANREMFLDLTRRTGGRTLDDGGVSLFFGVHPSWIIVNGGFRTDPAVAPRLVIDRVDAEFRSLGRRPALITFERTDADIDAALLAAGWVTAIRLPVMVRTKPFEAPRLDDPCVSLRRIASDDLDGLGDLRGVLERGFADDDEEREVVGSVFRLPAAIAPPETAAFVVDLEGRPVACATVYREGPGAVVGWVATVPEARRRGLGRFVTSIATNEGFVLGATFVTLQASPMGAPVYAAMGYETVSLSRVWVGPERA